MTAALLAAALAIATWPGPAAARRRRLGAVSGRRGRRAAGRRRPAAEPVPVPLLAGLAAVGVGAVAGTPLVAALAGAAGLAAARAWAAGRRDREGRARLLAVAEGVGAMAAELRSGRSLDAATRAAVAACGDEETGAALSRAVRSGFAGPAVPDPTVPGFAVRGAAAREAGVAGALDQVAIGVRLSGRTGCSLAAVLTAVEDDLRARHRLQLELRSLTAGPRSSAWLLAGLPLLGLAMGNGIGADPWQVLTTTGTGRLLLVAGVGLELAGLAWSRRLVDRALR